MEPNATPNAAGGTHRKIWGFPQPIFEAACMISCEGASVLHEPIDIRLDECCITVTSVQGSVAPWLAHVKVPRPEHIERSLWHNTLLCANAAVMRHASCAFGIDDDEQPRLIGQLFSSSDDPIGLARQLHRLHEVWRCAHSIATNGAGPVAHAHLEAFILPARGEPPRDAARREARIADFLIDSLLAMGLSDQQACQIAGSGRLRLDKAEIRFEIPPSGMALLMVITLHNALLDGTAESAMQLTMELMSRSGIAVGRTETGYQLLARWPCNGQARTEFGKYLTGFAELPTLLLADTTVYDPGDSDLDVLLPHL